MKTDLLQLIELSGSPYERGLQYGRAAKTMIGNTLAWWADSLGNFSGEVSGRQTRQNESYLNGFLKHTEYQAAIEALTPDLLEEIKGIAAGAGQDIQKVLGLQLMDEEWVYGLNQKLNRPTNKCTAFGLTQTASAMTYAGQNMDVPAWVEGQQMLLRIAATSTAPEVLVFTMAGNIGLNGINASGLGITCNTLAQLKPCIDGLPVAFIVRAVLSMHSIDEAESFLRSIKHASGQNYILSSKNDIRCLECSGKQVIPVPLSESSQAVFHTNHPLVSGDLGEQSCQCDGRRKNSVARLQSIANRLDSTKAVLNDIKLALAAHDDPDNPVSRVIEPSNQEMSIGYTAAGCIYEFGENPRLHLASGPPCETAFKTFEFKTYS